MTKQLYYTRRGACNIPTLLINSIFRDDSELAVITINKIHALSQTLPWRAMIALLCYPDCRQSRYERSARLDDNPSPSGRNSPLVGSAGSASGTHHPYLESSACPTLAYPNPRLPPYPFPVLVSPYVQLRQPLLHNLLGEWSALVSSVGVLATIVRSALTQSPKVKFGPTI